MSNINSEINLLKDTYFKEDYDGDRTLFLSVILQALLDATKPAYAGEPDVAVIDRDRARAWFSASVGVTAQDFSTVCELAGIDPSYTREFAYKVLESGEVTFIRKRINALLTHKE